MSDYETDLRELRESDRKALRKAVRDVLAACDEQDRFMGGTQPYISTQTIRRHLSPWAPIESGETHE